MIVDRPGAADLAPLLRKAGWRDTYRLVPLHGGANNRAYVVEGDGERVFLKVYFRHPADERNRLTSEFGFSTFCWERGVRCIPAPLAADDTQGLALFQYVDGLHVHPGAVREHHVREAIQFVLDVNDHRNDLAARALPCASEACFSITAHIACVTRRLDRLKALPVADDIDAEARDFVRDCLAAAWQATCDEVEASARSMQIDVRALLAADDRCLSPSDFGFHNAVEQPHGAVTFYDFEYAGWDDPAKLICDFFCQVAVPVPLSFFGECVECWSSMSAAATHTAQRAALLMPVYQIKWCCIVLNEFLPVSAARRAFSGDSSASAHRRGAQLEKARRLLAEVPAAKVMGET